MDNVFVSFDKLRLKFLVPDVFAKYLLDELIKQKFVDPTKDLKVGKEYYAAYALSCSVYDGSESGLWWGFDHVKENEGDLKKSLVIDFNPNKHPVDSGFFQVFRQALKNYLWEGPFVRSVDLAFDIVGYSMDEVSVEVKNARRFVNVMGTSYFGERERQVKKYDKQKERSKEGVEIEKTVRIEVTRPFKGHLSNFEKFPVDVSGVIVSLNQDGDLVDRCLSYCLNVGYVNLSELTRRQRQRISRFNISKQVNLQELLEISWEWECLRVRLYFGIEDYSLIPVEVQKYEFKADTSSTIGSIGDLFDRQGSFAPGFT